MLDLLEIFTDDVALVKNAKKSLQKKFSLTSYKDIDKAVILANYLLCLGKVGESKKLLESFVFDAKYDEDKEDLWGSIGQGIVLRAYIADIEKKYDLKEKIMEGVLENDIMTDRCSHYDLYLECLEDHVDNMERAEDETQKYKCEIYGQEALTFIYFYEVIQFKDKKIFHDISENILDKINSSYNCLKKNLK